MNAAIVINLGSLSGSNGYRVDGREPGDHAGSALNNVGDVNGDELDDYMIGAPMADPDGMQEAGEAYVVFGSIANPSSLSLDALNGNNGFRVVGAIFNDGAGTAVGGGDINRDGFADLIIGAPGADPNGLTEAGAVYVVFGASQFPSQIDLQASLSTSGVKVPKTSE